MITLAIPVHTSFWGDWLGSVKFLIKKNPGKFRLMIIKDFLVFEQKVQGEFVEMERMGVKYE